MNREVNIERLRESIHKLIGKGNEKLGEGVLLNPQTGCYCAAGMMLSLEGIDDDELINGGPGYNDFETLYNLETRWVYDVNDRETNPYNRTCKVIGNRLMKKLDEDIANGEIHSYAPSWTAF